MSGKVVVDLSDYLGKPTAGLPDEKPLETGGGGGDSMDMDARVTRLEEWAKLSDERMGRIETKIDALPSKTDLLTMVIATITTGLTIVGVVIGALSYFGDKAERAAPPAASAPPPIVIQLPTPPPAAPSR